MYEILERREMAQGTVVLNVIKAPKIAAKAKPGQFVIIRANETGERIPLTMADADPENGTITIIFQVVGKIHLLVRHIEGRRRLSATWPAHWANPLTWIKWTVWC